MHDVIGPTRLPVAAGLTAALAAAAGLLLAAGGTAHAASCTTMTFQFGPGGVELNPSKLTVAAGSCVTFANQTLTPVQFSVGKYKATAPAFGSATPNYVANPGGTTQQVTASGTTGTAHGSIVVKRAPVKPAPKPSHSSSSPKPSRTPTSRPSPSPSQQSPTAVAPSAPPPPTAPQTTPLTPSVNPPFLAGTPTPTPSPSQSSVTVVSGPLQPPTDRGTGLPAALAALAVVGTAGALLRVLLAEPVDSAGRTVGLAS